ncbi:hypothetical protein GIB67_008637 [Kingdonia uniflora]|uniref:Uncharacterized protein n=1 Tax=Kingdonia uniflora TaxID=39325 RepID=A0A7J7M4X6_9MAGN|nr:hypothetical protein GIB67_008637 [Kingdonia uniflora]
MIIVILQNRGERERRFYGEDSGVIPFGSSLLTSGDYLDVEIREKRVSHIENGSKSKVGYKKEDCSSTKKRRSVKRRSVTFSGEDKIFDSASNLIYNNLCDMTCDIWDKPCNVIHGTLDKSCWLSYSVCKRSRLDLDVPLKITSGKSELSSNDECYHIVDNGDIQIPSTNDNSLSSDMVQNVFSLARNMLSSQLSDLGLLATFGDHVFAIMKDATTLAWDKIQDAFFGTCSANDKIISIVTSMVNFRV